MLGKAKRIASTLAATLLFTLLTVASGHAQATTGKIQGRVVSSTGQPIASAQVTVDGTNLGNITNDDGFYFVNQVPAGLHTVRAQSIGYRTQAIADQRILAGQTVTLNFELEQAAVALEALVVTGERNPLVPRDQVSSKAIVTGETIDQLPLDRASSIILLQPGIVSTASGYSIRGSREGEEAVYVDGVPVRSLRNGNTTNMDIPTNALAQVDVTTGGISARYGNAQSGVINYVTKTGAANFGGTVSLQTDMLSPKSWRSGFNRAELSLGGPLFMQNLSFFIGGTAEGQKYGGRNQGINALPQFVASGVDTVIRMPRTSAGVSTATDSVDVVIPNYIEWDNGPTSPSSVSSRYNLTAKVSYGLGQGSKVDLTYYRYRNQNISRANTSGLLNPDNWTGGYSTQNTLTLGGYFLVKQTAEQALALDLKASYQRDWSQSGSLDRQYLESHLSPRFMNFKPLEFIMDPDQWPVTDALLQGLKANVLPDSLHQMVPQHGELTARVGVEGISQNLRLNPFAIRSAPPGFSNFSTSGGGNVGQGWGKESRIYTTATADWQVNRFNRVWLGAEMTKATAEGRSMTLYTGRGSAYSNKPTTAGVFLQDRLDIGDVVLEGGLRMDYFDPAGEFPRIPGFVFYLPDSLTKDLYRVQAGDPSVPVTDRLYNNGDCGGDATAASRRNATTGELVCKNNFIPTKKRTIVSPKLAVSFPVTATSTFRLSYGQNAQPPALVGSGGILDDIYSDLAGGSANTNTTYGRDVDIPTTVLFEAGYRQVFGGNTVIDVAAYSKTNRNALAYRKLQYTNPVTGASTFINSLQNADYSLARGADVRFDRRLSELADLSINYTFLDARGTGSDPTTYTSLILRRNTNLSILTGQPVESPEVLQTLDQSRAHTLSGTLSMNLGGDFAETNRLANMVLGDVGLYMTMRVASGLPYTRLINEGNGQTGPPTRAGNAGKLAEQINSSRTPLYKALDLRLTKGLSLMGKSARVFADWRNPLNIANTNTVWVETGTVYNNVYKENFMNALLTQTTLDGDSNVDDFDIVREAETTNPVNQYMLLAAEQRWGLNTATSVKGDGIFTVEEQKNMYNVYYTLFNGAHDFRTSNQALRLGFELNF